MNALKILKDWWWLATAMGGALILWGSLPDRVRKVEASQSKQQEQMSELREWTKETQGFLKGQAALNERLAAQQASVVEEVADDGEIKVMEMDGKRLCCNGSTCWPYHVKQKCVR